MIMWINLYVGNSNQSTWKQFVIITIQNKGKELFRCESMIKVHLQIK